MLKRKILLRQIRLIVSLTMGIVFSLLLINLAYLVDSELRNTESQVQIQGERIYIAVADALLRAKDQDPKTVIANDISVRSTLQLALSKLPIIKYVAIVDDKDQPLTLVTLSNSKGIDLQAQDIRGMADGYSFTTVGALLFTNTNYHYSFSTALGRKGNGNLSFVTIRFGVSAANLRSSLANIFLLNLFLLMGSLGISLFIALRSTTLLSTPLEDILNQMEKLEKGEFNLSEVAPEAQLLHLPIINKLHVLSRRLAGERKDLETTQGRLTQIIGNIEERLLMLNADKRVMLMSPKVDHLLGVAGLDLAGAKIEDKLGNNHAVVELINRAQSSRTSIENVILVEQTDGQSKQVVVSVQYIEDKGEMVGMLLSLRDFDSFRQFQSQLDYSDKLAALSRVTSGVAHEVKNPLNAMVIHLEILRSKIEQGGDITPQLDILSSEIKRLDRVVQTFLNFTKPVQINLVPIDLNDLVHQVTRLAAAEADIANVTIREDLSPEYLRVNGDADLLKQTILNIIINGCQAMPNGGPLEIKTFRSRGYAVITVSDRGMGITSEAKDKIFKLYYTSKAKGNGIGLAQAFRIIQLHNGRIDFESVPDVGTIFKIFLVEV